MSLSALFSIKPEYAEKIFSGKKKFEFRTKCCKKKIDKIMIYETSPVCKVVGEVSVLTILCDTPQNIWEQTKKYAGIEYKRYMDYFSNRKVAYAYVLDKPVRYENALSLENYNISSAPQSYIYLKA